MQPPRLCVENSGLIRRDVPTLSVVVVFQDDTCRHRGVGAYKTLITRLGNEFCFSHKSWSLAALNSGRLRPRSLADAAKADIVILSLRKPACLELHSWVEDWGRHKAHRPAALLLLALNPCPPSVDTQAEIRRLAVLARSFDIDFFSDLPDCRDPATEIATLE